jgi:hypothetical protein
MARNNRKVHIVMAHDHVTNETYISEVCSSKKKAEEFQVYINRVMNEGEPTIRYIHWVHEQRVV